MTPEEAFKTAVKLMGGQSSSSKILKITQGLISRRISNKIGASPADCLKIEIATNKKINRYQLRPDIFGRPPKA